jgi:quinol monooxygenase YgiN
MITILARLQILPDKENLAIESLRVMSAAVQANEPGCLMYHVTRSLTDVDEVYVYEIYQDENALRTHSETPHMREFRSALEQWSDRAHFNVETLDETAGFVRADVSVSAD